MHKDFESIGQKRNKGFSLKNFWNYMVKYSRKCRFAFLQMYAI